MKRKFAFIGLFALIFSVGHVGLAKPPVHLHDDEGEFEDVDIQEDGDTSFFLDDANEFQISMDAAQPDMMPCEGIITSEFGWRRLSRSRARLHKGVDIAAPVGSPVMAPADGRVAFAGRKNGYGLTVIIDHGGNLTTLFGHNSDIFVSEGQMVKKGQEISRVGMTGHTTGPHVHYEVRVEGNPVNPTRFF